MKYNPNEIESKWQKYWAEKQTFKSTNQSDKKKYYVLDMFPYPSGAGLHVGHPLGYIASDITARYKRHQGYNVLHPQGYDSFGLPAEQYAIQTGQHPAITTETNIKRYREQLDKIGFSFDWSREVRTSNPDYYRWTQWIFIQLFNAYYCNVDDKAEDISVLIKKFERAGNTQIDAVCDNDTPSFTAEEWNSWSTDKQQEILLKYRMTYLAETEVNWCPALGTVLANDEIINGVSERGGHPVIRKKMKQWSMRISAYAERLLQGLDTVDWTESLKESQRNWIGKSVGATVKFKVSDSVENNNHQNFIEVFTTRPDTIFGVSFMTLAPEHDLVMQITTDEQKEAVTAYIEATAKRSERERMADVKTISGVFTGAYAIHPLSQKLIPIWIGDYVLAGYGTGAVMAVPCGDERDYAFAKHFGIDIHNIFNQNIAEAAFTEKEGFELINSDFLNGMDYKTATAKVIEELEKIDAGQAKVNYRLRDAVFSRQRYWGEPFPVYYVNDLPQIIDAEHLPIRLPEVEKYLPTEDGQPPLGNANDWAWDTVNNKVVATTEIDHQTIFPLELNTMPGWAGSSWYWLRYMDAHNDNEFASEEVMAYWQNVDLYIGGSEHATGHLLYARFWNKFLKDKKLVPTEEPFKKLINQGMILGNSAYVNRIKRGYFEYDENINQEELEKRDEVFDNIFSDELSNAIISADILQGKKLYDAIDGELYSLSEIVENLNIDLSSFTNNGFEIDKIKFSTYRVRTSLDCINLSDELNFDKFNIWNREDIIKRPIKNKEGKIKVEREVEKMSKSFYNVVNPDDICNEYGADTLRLYEMFLGPLEQTKPWNTAGIIGVYGFLKKLWKLYFNDEGLQVTADEPTKEMYKTLHKTIKKVTEDIETFSFNTSVSQFMICVNELSQQKCYHRAILEPLAVLLSPYAPHMAEELWQNLGYNESISTVAFPVFEEKYLVESDKEYPVSFNGKMRFKINLSLALKPAEIEKIILEDPRTQEQLQGRETKKVIVVPGKIINIVG